MRAGPQAKTQCPGTRFPSCLLFLPLSPSALHLMARHAVAQKGLSLELNLLPVPSGLGPLAPLSQFVPQGSGAASYLAFPFPLLLSVYITLSYFVQKKGRKRHPDLTCLPHPGAVQGTLSTPLLQGEVHARDSRGVRPLLGVLRTGFSDVQRPVGYLI